MSTLNINDIKDVQVGDLWFSKYDPTVGWKVIEADHSGHYIRFCLRIDITGHELPVFIRKTLGSDYWVADSDFGHAERHVPDWPDDPTDVKLHF